MFSVTEPYSFTESEKNDVNKEIILLTRKREITEALLDAEKYIKG